MSVEYRILGPLEVLVDGAPASLGGPQQRAVLAILLAQANQAVPAERLVDGVWGESPPDTASKLVQVYVSRLRKEIGKEAITTRGRGYSAVVAPGALDLELFEQRAEEGMAGRQRGAAEIGRASCRGR